MQTLISNQSSATQDLVNTSSDSIQALLRSQNDATQLKLRDFRDLNLRLTIESVLQAGVGQEVASFQLLEPWGQLATVRKIVQETIASMTIAGCMLLLRRSRRVGVQAITE